MQNQMRDAHAPPSILHSPFCISAPPHFAAYSTHFVSTFCPAATVHVASSAPGLAGYVWLAVFTAAPPSVHANVTSVADGLATSYARWASTLRYDLPPSLPKRTRTGPFVPAGNSTSPQQKLWLQK